MSSSLNSAAEKLNPTGISQTITSVTAKMKKDGKIVSEWNTKSTAEAPATLPAG